MFRVETYQLRLCSVPSRLRPFSDHAPRISSRNPWPNSPRWSFVSLQIPTAQSWKREMVQGVGDKGLEITDGSRSQIVVVSVAADLRGKLIASFSSEIIIRTTTAFRHNQSCGDHKLEPINLICWRRAICLEFMEKAVVLEYYDQTISSPSGSFYIPAVLRAHKDFDIHAIPLTAAALKVLKMRKGFPDEWRQHLAQPSAEP